MCTGEYNAKIGINNCDNETYHSDRKFKSSST